MILNKKMLAGLFRNLIGVHLWESNQVLRNKFERKFLSVTFDNEKRKDGKVKLVTVDPGEV